MVREFLYAEVGSLLLAWIMRSLLRSEPVAVIAVAVTAKLGAPAVRRTRVTFLAAATLLSSGFDALVRLVYCPPGDLREPLCRAQPWA
jgi:hypothetical protein